VKLHRNASPIKALVQLQSEKEELAQVLDAQGRTVGLLYATDLAESLFRISR
jgi:CBS domain containing-hemolysin-like protein